MEIDEIELGDYIDEDLRALKARIEKMLEIRAQDRKRKAFSALIQAFNEYQRVSGEKGLPVVVSEYNEEWGGEQEEDGLLSFDNGQFFVEILT